MSDSFDAPSRCMHYSVTLDVPSAATQPLQLLEERAESPGASAKAYRLPLFGVCDSSWDPKISRIKR